MAADAGPRGPLPEPSRALPRAPPWRQGRERSPAAPGRGGLHTKRSGTPQPPPGPGTGTARRAPSADGRRRLSSPRPSGAGGRAGCLSPPLTHSSVPQLMAELEATRAVWLPRYPSVDFAVSLSDLSLADRRSRGCAPPPPKVPPQPGSPVSEKESTGEAAAASPPPGAGREGAPAEGRRDPERGGGGTRCTLGSGRTRVQPATAGRVLS